MLSKISARQKITTISVTAIVIIIFSIVFIYKINLSNERASKELSLEINKNIEENKKLTFLLSLNRPSSLTTSVQAVIDKADNHLYAIRNDDKEQKFTRCMMQAITGMTGSLGYYIDIKACGDTIKNKTTLNLFKELDALEVAPECQSTAIETQWGFDRCKAANEDYRAKTGAMNILFKLVTNYSLAEMWAVASKEYR